MEGIANTAIPGLRKWRTRADRELPQRHNPRGGQRESMQKSLDSAAPGPSYGLVQGQQMVSGGFEESHSLSLEMREGTEGVFSVYGGVLAMPRGMWAHSFPTMDQTCASCSGSPES